MGNSKKAVGEARVVVDEISIERKMHILAYILRYRHINTSLLPFLRLRRIPTLVFHVMLYSQLLWLRRLCGGHHIPSMYSSTPNLPPVDQPSGQLEVHCPDLSLCPAVRGTGLVVQSESLRQDSPLL